MLTYAEEVGEAGCYLCNRYVCIAQVCIPALGALARSSASLHFRYSAMRRASSGTGCNCSSVSGARQKGSCGSERRCRHITCSQSHTSAYVSIRQHTSACVPILLHTSAYVRIRQHTSAYVSIRQHKSAYVGIRQHSRCRHITCSQWYLEV
jgi:hypothetical protein